MRLALVVIACAACGSPMPAGAPDAQPDARIGHGRVANVVTARSMTGSSSVTIPPAAGGDWIEVIVARSGQAHRSTGVHVGNASLVEASGALAVSPCGAATEVWIDGFVLGAPAGTTDVVVDRDDDAPFSVIVVDLLGIDSLHDESSLHPVAADPGAVVLSTATTCGAVSGLTSSSPFTAIAVGELGTSVAYDVPVDAGTYGARWSTDGGPSVAYDVAFE